MRTKTKVKNKVSIYYRCNRGHNVDIAISNANSCNLICPECESDLCFRVKEYYGITDNPITTEVEFFWDKLDYRIDHDLTSIEYDKGCGHTHLSNFDYPRKITKQILANEEIKYDFHYNLSGMNDGNNWIFKMSGDTAICLKKYTWQEKKYDQRNLFQKLFNYPIDLPDTILNMPTETTITIIRGTNKADMLRSCTSMMLMAEKLTTRLNARLCRWLITQF